MIQPIQLLPCPFCGETPKPLTESKYFRCTTPGCLLLSIYATAEEWNQRAPVRANQLERDIAAEQDERRAVEATLRKQRDDAFAESYRNERRAAEAIERCAKVIEKLTRARDNARRSEDAIRERHDEEVIARGWAEKQRDTAEQSVAAYRAERNSARDVVREVRRILGHDHAVEGATKTVAALVAAEAERDRLQKGYAVLYVQLSAALQTARALSPP